ncbi:hypothetical protein LW957_17500, partial [Erwinia amylovora]|uniref:hypothetical protein n=1 Tax=Erwinia amylovora TaxID=552 RepID=UPI0020BED196
MGQWVGLSQAAIAKRISTRAVVFNVEELDVIADRFGVTVQSLFDPPRSARPFPGGLVTAGADRPVTHKNHTPGIVTGWNVAGRGEFGLAT